MSKTCLERKQGKKACDFTEADMEFLAAVESWKVRMGNRYPGGTGPGHQGAGSVITHANK